MVGNFAPDEGFAWWLMENFWIELAHLARQTGLQPLLIYRDEGVVPQSIVAAGIPTNFRPFLVPESSLASDLRFVRQHRVRFVYLTDRSFWDLRYGILRGAGVRCIVTHDHVPGDPPEAGGFRGWIKGLRNRIPLLTADVQLAVSPFVKKRAERCGRIPTHRVAVIQNGIPPIRCHEFPPDYVNRTFGIPPDRTICVMAGRAHRYKRVDFLIEVARKVHQLPGGDGVTFLFCGDGPHLEWLQGLAKEAKLGDSFVFAGRRDDLPAILCSCDMALHPSQGEAFSLAVIEYMSAGLPVLVPDLPSVSQAVDDGHTGFVYPDGDADKACELVLRLHREVEARRVMGTRASNKATEEYGLDGMNDSFVQKMAPCIEKCI